MTSGTWSVVCHERYAASDVWQLQTFQACQLQIFVNLLAELYLTYASPLPPVTSIQP